MYVTSPTTQTYHPPLPGATATLARSFAVPSVPANLTNDADVKAYLAPAAESMTSLERADIVVPRDNVEGSKDTLAGANLLVVDMEPGGQSPMHRTVSLDFSICTIGTIIHELDSGERVTLKPGVSHLCTTWEHLEMSTNKWLAGPHRAARHKS